MTEIDSQSLVRQCDRIFDASGEAVAWVADARRRSERLDRRAEGMTIELRQIRNRVRRLGLAATRPVALGFFGISQAGKSYLVSSLAANEAGELETEMDGRRLNFIAHINPPGGGKEATGLVTRFTRHAGEVPDGHPVALTMFSEADLVKVLGNSFYNDFDREKFDQDIGPERIRALLSELEKAAQPGPQPGITQDDAVDIRDYFFSHFSKSMDALEGDFWPTVLRLAHRLKPADRARLFSILWGEIAILTDSYRQLCDGLAKIGHARKVFAALDCLVREDGQGAFSQAGSIMNVDCLQRLGVRDEEEVSVIPHDTDTGFGAPAGLARPLLAALTSEMEFRLVDPPRAAMIEQVDLLDFPGYRSRLGVRSIEEIGAAVDNADANPAAELILRGKVSFLFERYIEDQEMNFLSLCTPCNQQIDVPDLAPALESWIRATQGEDAAARGQRPPGLFWCVTKFDARLVVSQGQTDDLLRQAWAGMIHIALIERFGKYDWLKQWAPDRPFDNVFLLRKPGMAEAVIESSEHRERRIRPDKEEQIALLRRTFLAEPSVQAHIRDHEAAWDAMLTLDDGGAGRLAEALSDVVKIEVKLGRIAEQIAAIRKEAVEHLLGPWYAAEGAEEEAHKRKIARRIVQALTRSGDSVGALLHLLQPNPEMLHSTYMRAESVLDTPADEGEDAAAAPPAQNVLIGLPFGDEEEGAQGEGAAGGHGGRASRAVTFAREAFSHWVTAVKRLAERPEIVRHLGIEGETLRLLGNELVTGAHRYRLERRLIDALDEGEARASATRSGLAVRQVIVAQRIFGSFIEMLGQDILAREDRAEADKRMKLADGRKVFDPPPPVPDGRLPDLPDAQIPFAAIFLTDWFRAFEAMAVNNAGERAGREISPEQNEKLGEILADFRATG